MMDQTFTVSQLNTRIAGLLDADPVLSAVCVRGELSNYKVYPSGHHYFTLKDAESTLSCVMFKGNASRLRFRPESGMSVLVSGVLYHEWKTFVRVSLMRGNVWAEGIVPDGVVEKAKGFSTEEIGQLQAYLAAEKETIIRQAKGINPIRILFQI